MTIVKRIIDGGIDYVYDDELIIIVDCYTDEEVEERRNEQRTL